MIKKSRRLPGILIIGEIILGVAWIGRSTPAPNVTGATITGVVSGVSRRALRASDASRGIEVTVVDTTISAGVEPDGSFTLTGVAPSDVVLRFEGPGIDAELSLGIVAASDRLDISVRVSGTTATLDHQQRTGSDNKTDADGQIVSTAADARRFGLSGSVIEVPAGAMIRREGTVIDFSDLKRGDRARVRGVKQEGGGIYAASVDVTTLARMPTSRKSDDSGRVTAAKQSDGSVLATAVQVAK
jgi:hypothetical protein